MCDEFTEADRDDRQARAAHPLDRRAFGLGGASAALLAALPACATGAGPDADADLHMRTVLIPTPDGKADAWFIAPAEGAHPAVILWPDIAGMREAYRETGLRLARAGYAVLVVNPYYRSAPAPVLASFAEWRTEAGQARLKPMIAALSPAGTVRDAAAFIDWLDRQPAVDARRRIGTLGYCMGGPFAFRTALARPERVGAVASFHGAGLVTDAADSPHRLIPRLRADLLIAIARNDDTRQPEAKTLLRAAADAAHRPAEIEVYPAQHGWCTTDSPAYDPAQAEKAWDRLLATFRHAL